MRIEMRFAVGVRTNE